MWKSAHAKFLMTSVEGLGSGYQALDASKPWMSYWILHSLDLMKVEITEKMKSDSLISLRSCQIPTGGFGGSIEQISHLAPR